MNREIYYDEVFDAQGHFRLILDSMAKPGKINTFPEVEIANPPGINKSAILVAFALLNSDVSFCATEDVSGNIAEYIKVNTSSFSTNTFKANFVFINEQTADNEIDNINIGTLPFPEEGSTLVIDVDLISPFADEKTVELNLKGPGVNGFKSIFISGINPSVLGKIKEKNMEFPLGMDVIFCDKKGQIAALPRSNNFSYSG